MGIYYISACHTCKEKANWDKTSSHQAYIWHIHHFKKLHPEHDVKFSNDYDDEFWDKVWKYKNIRIESKGVGLS